jgi:uncharacterized protein (UPF0332 family)
MPPLVLPRVRLVRVSKSRKEVIDNWAEGVSLCNDSGQTIPELMQLVSVDRWCLACEHRRQANRLRKISMYRSSVSRYYYAMYHAIRACIYIFHGGDDHEKHLDLPKNIPADFDPGVNWQNKLKDARELRNDSDYNPYPKSDLAWRAAAENLKVDADRLISLTRTYLISKGCKL